MSMSPWPLAKRYRLPPASAAPAGLHVVPRETLAALQSAQAVLAAAEQERDRLIDAAHEEAEAIRATAREGAERAVWQQAQQALQALAELRRQLAEQAEDLLMNTLREALERLLLDVPADWPPRSNLRLLLAERSADADARLLIHSQDRALLPCDSLADTACSIVDDDAVPRGTCVLTCMQGEVRASYRANVQSLVQALSSPSG
jgi:flagellar biosynthesis/type III secretory pathway protein FliH